MLIELTQEQSQALTTERGEACLVIDPKTQRTYRLITTDVYDKMQALVCDSSPWTEHEMAALAGAAFGKLDDIDYSHYLRESS